MGGNIDIPYITPHKRIENQPKEPKNRQKLIFITPSKRRSQDLLFLASLRIAGMVGIFDIDQIVGGGSLPLDVLAGDLTVDNDQEVVVF